MYVCKRISNLRAITALVGRLHCICLADDWTGDCLCLHRKRLKGLHHSCACFLSTKNIAFFSNIHSISERRRMRVISNHRTKTVCLQSTLQVKQKFRPFKIYITYKPLFFDARDFDLFTFRTTRLRTGTFSLGISFRLREKYECHNGTGSSRG